MNSARGKGNQEGLIDRVGLHWELIKEQLLEESAVGGSRQEPDQRKREAVFSSVAAKGRRWDREEERGSTVGHLPPTNGPQHELSWLYTGDLDDGIKYAMIFHHFLLSVVWELKIRLFGTSCGEVCALGLSQALDVLRDKTVLRQPAVLLGGRM